MMQEGKISQAVYERSICRPLHFSGGLSAGAGYGKDCIVDADGQAFAAAGGPVAPEEGSSSDMPAHTSASCPENETFPTPAMLFAEVLNKLGGAIPRLVFFNLTLPASAQEKSLKKISERLGKMAEKTGVRIGALNVETSSQVKVPLLDAYAAGKLPEVFPGDPSTLGKPSEDLRGRRTGNMGESVQENAQAGLDLVMAGEAGLAGTAVLERAFHEKLSGHFPERFLEGARIREEDLLTGQAGKRIGNGAVFKSIGRGGVFAALWEMCEALGCGLEADIHQIPIRQETVEICEYLNRNPYRLYGTGALLAAVPDGEEVCRKLCEEGFRAQMIGKLTRGPGRYIHNREITRCLEKPLPDALLMEG